MIAVVAVRDGELPLGADEATAEAGGHALVAGTGTAVAAEALAGAATTVSCWEAGEVRPGTWAASLAPELAREDVVVLPASPDGRDLAPRLALALHRPLYAPCTEIAPAQVAVVRRQGQVLVTYRPTEPFVATLQPGVRGTSTRSGRTPQPPQVTQIAPPPQPVADARTLAVTEPDPAAVALADARAIVAAGAGLGSAGAVTQLGHVAAALHCALGATRVVTDAGWAPTERQIGTTGVVVSPDLYVAVGISGAVQHVSGIGRPRHVVAVNHDPSCPMMALADLALVTDAPGCTAALAERLGVTGGAGA